jgi:hypothetical protein
MRILLATFISLMFASAAPAQECTQEKAVEAAQVDPAVTTLCGMYVNGAYSPCRYSAAEASPGGAGAVLPKWIVTVNSKMTKTPFSFTDNISSNCEVMEETSGCAAEKAIEAAKANPAVINFCNQKIYGPLFKCEFRAGRSAIYPLGERSNPGMGWLVNASTFMTSAFTKVSPGCRVIQHPFFAKTVEVGSIELGVMQSRDIVIGKVVDVQSPEPVLVNGGAKIQSETVTVEVSKVLKGDNVSKVVFDRSFSFPYTSAKAMWLNDGEERLFFISRSGLAGSTDNPACRLLAHYGGSSEAQQSEALHACQRCVDLETKTGQRDETQPSAAFMSCIGKIPLQDDIVADAKMVILGKPTLYQKPVILGNWPNGIVLKTGRDSTPYPVFSRSGEVLRTEKDILNAVQAESAAETAKPHAQSPKDWEEKTDLNSDKYPQAYEAGIPKGSVVVLDVPKE